MKKIHKALNIIVLLAIITTSFTACDEDFTNLESGISINTNFSTSVDTFAVRAYTKRLERVQTNGLPIGMLGLYKDPIYGNTTSNFLSQMSPNVLDPTFGEQVVLDSVILTLPYFSTLLDIDSENNSTFELDSIISNNEDSESLSPIKLSIYRNNYFLRDFDIGDDSDFNESLIYFSDGMTSEGTQINEVTDVQGDILYEDISFIPSAEQITLIESDGDVIPVSPSLRIRLDQEVNVDNDNNINTTTHKDKEYWDNLIFDKEGDIVLSNLNNFFNYFRGLYFKAESIDNDGFFMFFNYSSSANLTFHYSSTTTDPETQEEVTTQNSYVLNFSGTNLNFLNNSDNSLLSDGNPSEGDETLYLKGGQGTMTVIDLFDENIEGSSFCEFMQAYKSNYNCNTLNNNESEPKRLINEAFIKIFVDQNLVQDNELDRVYLYDIKNNTPLIDYFIDPTSTKEIHLEPLKRNEENSTGISYKIRITEHLNNIITRDSTNLSLGLVVSNNVPFENNSINLESITSDSEINKIPVSSITQPRGTILNGSHPNVPKNLRMKLEVYYTCINEDGDCFEDSIDSEN